MKRQYQRGRSEMRKEEGTGQRGHRKTLQEKRKWRWIDQKNPFKLENVLFFSGFFTQPETQTETNFMFLTLRLLTCFCAQVLYCTVLLVIHVFGYLSAPPFCVGLKLSECVLLSHCHSLHVLMLLHSPSFSTTFCIWQLKHKPLPSRLFIPNLSTWWQRIK